MGSQYGITSAMSDVMGGYEKEEGMQAKRAAAGQQSEISRMELDKLRAEAKAEGSKEAIKMMLRGDLQGAMDKYNAQGEGRMQNLQINRKEGVVSWESSNGDQQIVALPQLMASVGLDPKDLDTPDAKLGRDKELATHQAQLKRKYGIGTGKDSRTAYRKNLEYLMEKFTKGNPRKALELLQLSKSDPRSAHTRILSDLRKANDGRRRKAKWTEEQMNKMAADSVSGFANEMFDRLIPGENKPATDPASTTAPVSGIDAEPYDPNNPSALWR